MDYQKEALKTLSKEFHGELVESWMLDICLKDFIRFAELLDRVKKALFYGKPTDLAVFNDCIDLPKTVDVDVLHAILGVLTEAGEFAEVLHKYMISGEIDRTNVIEELGDMEWYMALLREKMSTTQEEVQMLNIKKLQGVRYKKGFTSEDAENRDLEAEREALEK